MVLDTNVKNYYSEVCTANFSARFQLPTDVVYCIKAHRYHIGKFFVYFIKAGNNHIGKFTTA